MKRTKIIALTVSLLTLCLVAFSGIAQAQGVRTGDSVAVAISENIDGMLFIGGGNVNIAGNVDGDVFCAGQNVTISGNVDGDVFCAGQNINISGDVDGSVRLAAQSVTISGTVGNSATIAAQTLLLDKGAVIERDLTEASQTANIDGLVGRDFVAALSSLTIDGTVGRNIVGNIYNLDIGSTGIVKGNIDYTSSNTPIISDGGQIKGSVSITPFKEQTPNKYHSPASLIIMTTLYVLVSTLVLAFVISLVFPKLLKETTARAIKSPGRTALVGFISAIAAPMLIIGLFVSFIGVPLAILTLLAWIVILMLSMPFVGYMFGQIIFKGNNSLSLKMLVGVGILSLLCLVPFLGLFVIIAVHLFGVGMLVDEFIKYLSKKK